MATVLDQLADEVLDQSVGLPEAALAGTVCAAVSGGADSIALLAILDRVRERGRIGEVCVVHVDHGLRADSSLDLELVEAVASRRGLPFRAARLALGRPPTGKSPETRARELRYAALGRMASEAGSRLLVTAHHRDDQIETVLFRILRGTGVAGLRGIPRVRRLFPNEEVWLWRPLLHTSQAGLRTLVDEIGAAFREDPTNRETNATRNRIRLELLPFLRDRFGDRVEQALGTLIGSADQIAGAIEREADALAERFVTEPFEGRLAIAVGAGAGSRPAREALVRACLQRLEPHRFIGPPPRLLAEIAGLLDPAVAVGTRRGDRIAVLAERQADAVYLQGLPLPGAPPEIAVERLPATVSWPHPPATLRFEEEVDGQAARRTLELARTDRNLAVLDLDRIKLPLRVSAPRAGDRFRPLGAPHARKLSAFLSSRHVPRLDRGHLPVLRAADDCLLWIPGVEVGADARITGATRRCLIVRSA